MPDLDTTNAPGPVVYPPANFVPSVQWTNAAQPPAPSAAGGMELLRQQVSNMPIDKAAEAVGQAMKFQAIRGYQKDLEAGKPANEALARWAPMMFSTPKSATMSGAASLIRAAQPKVMNASGQLWRVPGTGTASPLTPAPVKVPAPNRFDLQEHSSYLSQARALETELAKDPSGPDADAQRKEIQRLQGEAAKVRQRNTPAARRIKVKSKAGKVGTIPESQLDAALAEGYTRVQ